MGGDRHELILARVGGGVATVWSRNLGWLEAWGGKECDQEAAVDDECQGSMRLFR